MNEFDVLLARKLGGGSGDTYTKAQIDAKLAEKVGFSDIDTALSTTSENPVQNKAVAIPLNAATTKLQGIDSTDTNYIEMENGIRLYISSTAPTGTIPDGSIGVGW